MSPYLLLGFLLAGLLHAFVPSAYFSRFLSKPTFSSVVYAAIFGIPLPLCSCGVIPTAMSLRNDGASKGAVTSFMIATPQTGVDSIVATYSLMGWPFALVRPFAALFTAVFGGAMVNAFASSSNERQSTANCACVNGEKTGGFVQKLKTALHYAFVEMMHDIGRWLVLGLVVAALITILVPDSYFEMFKGNTFASMLLVLLMAIPMYLCATGSIPIAVALMLKGLTPGAALVLLMAGPACNLASILVVRKVLGTRALVTYLFSIVAGAVAFGCLVDFLQMGGAVDFTESLVYSKACCAHPDSWFAWACTGLLAVLLVNALVVSRFVKGDSPAKAEDPHVTVYHVRGMSCNHCRAAAEKAILRVPGVQTAVVYLESEEAHVTGSASKDSVAAALDAIGFDLED